MEPKTARITVLIDPVRKQALEKLSAEQDLTPSQVVRRLIREYLAAQAGSDAAGSGKRKAQTA